MNKIFIPLMAIWLIFGSTQYSGTTTAPVTIAGGIIKAKSVDNVKKYKRKDCPVCEGKGWYISGDKITKVPCGYCEEEKEQPKNKTSISSDEKCKTIIIRR